MTRRRRSISWAVAVAAAGILAGGSAVAQLTGAGRDSFVQASIKSCSDTVRGNSPGLSAEPITTYCTCMANGEADIMTPADIAYMTEHQAAPDDYRQRVQALAPACKKAAGLH